MDTVTSTTSTETMRTSHIRRGRKAPASAQNAFEKTPERELMSVEEYFDKVWERYLEKYENLQS